MSEATETDPMRGNHVRQDGMFSHPVLGPGDERHATKRMALLFAADMNTSA